MKKLGLILILIFICTNVSAKSWTQKCYYDKKVIKIVKGFFVTKEVTQVVYIKNFDDKEEALEYAKNYRVEDNVIYNSTDNIWQVWDHIPSSGCAFMNVTDKE